MLLKHAQLTSLVYAGLVKLEHTLLHVTLHVCTRHVVGHETFLKRTVIGTKGEFIVVDQGGVHCDRNSEAMPGMLNGGVEILLRYIV
ncbi:hypothetical protein L195_g042429 [Trifolium pratense]|uniref:Uncharacterized protein n=1 Tax=Trifolium pratense TaxID=57577 RepID=A0A2K3M6D7_TRIPR|nr:hypothetical protein L195_g042429 [Trifolium pratense]